MPNKCCVPGCKGNYTSENKVAVFSFPTDNSLRKKWISAIPRKNFTPTKHTKVCESHFRKEDVIRFVTEQDNKSGKIISARLGHPRLKADAIPSNFPNCPSYISSSVQYRKSRQDKLAVLEQEQLQVTIAKSLHEYEKSQKLLSYSNYSEFLTTFSSYQLPPGWFTMKDTDQNTIIFKLKYTPGPVITYSVVVSSDLIVTSFLYSQEIHLSVGKLTTPFTSNNISDIKCLLEKLEPLNCSSQDLNNSNINISQTVIHHILELMDTVNTEENLQLSFVNEQLKLHVSCKERYRYSANTILVSSILYTISPHAYRFLRKSGSVILPHPTTITGICSRLLTDPTLENKEAFLRYAKNIYKYVSTEDNHMILLMDEIHIQPYMDYKGGNLVGNSCNNRDLATSAYVFMINGIKSNFKEVIHIAPVSHIRHDLLYTFIQTLIISLEEIGYKIFCIVSDNNSINSKAMSSFSNDKRINIVYPHPVDNRRPLFYMFDSVHLLKCIRNNWLNSKHQQILTYPDFNNYDVVRMARFEAIQKLHELEHDKLLKFGYSLNVKSLFPSNIEKQNVKLVLKVFNSFVIEGLKQFGSNITGSEDTAEFIAIILRWWNIVNVKTPLKGKRLADPYQEPIVSGKIDDPKLTFLHELLNWLDTWKDEKYSKKLTNQTHSALTHTVYCMLEVVNYCFEELKMNYVLLGKFQTDPLESRFGKYRQLAGGQYNISIRQLYECEKRLRIQSLLTLKSRAYGNICISEFVETSEKVQDDEEVSDNNFSPIIVVSDDDFENIISEMPVIIYLGGYCCYIALRKFTCETCKNMLVYKEDLIVEDNYSLIRNLSRGALLLPREHVVTLVSTCYIIFNKILCDFEEEFLCILSKRNFLCKYIFNHNYVKDNVHNFNSCKIHSEGCVIKIIINSTVNTLMKNYCGKRNNSLCKGKNRKLCTFQRN